MKGGSNAKRTPRSLACYYSRDASSAPDAASNDNATAFRPATANDRPAFLADARAGRDLVALYHDYSSALVAHVRKLVGDADEAADIVQGLFVSLMEKNALHGVVNPKSFLYRAARNAALDHLRSAYRRNKTQDDDVVDEFEDEEIVSAERAMISRQNLSIVMRTMDKLPARQRRILVAYHIDGRSWADVARSAGVSIRTAQYECRRALTVLKNELGERC